MTVSTVVDHNDYTGNGVTTSFPYTFRIFKKTDLTVSVIDLSENITVLVLDTDYTVTNAVGFNGGSVVLTTPLASGWQISIARELEPTQETDLRNQGKFFAEVHEDAFDKLTMLIQQAYSMFRLALRKPSSIANWYDAMGNYIRNLRDPRDPQDAATKNYVDSVATTNLSHTLRTPEAIPVLPAVEQRKNKIVAMNDSGDPIMVLPESGSAADVLIELAKPTGASRIGYNGSTVADELDKSNEVYKVYVGEKTNSSKPIEYSGESHYRPVIAEGTQLGNYVFESPVIVDFKSVSDSRPPSAGVMFKMGGGGLTGFANFSQDNYQLKNVTVIGGTPEIVSFEQFTGMTAVIDNLRVINNGSPDKSAINFKSQNWWPTVSNNIFKDYTDKKGNFCKAIDDGGDATLRRVGDSRLLFTGNKVWFGGSDIGGTMLSATGVFNIIQNNTCEHGQHAVVLQYPSTYSIIDGLYTEGFFNGAAQVVLGDKVKDDAIPVMRMARIQVKNVYFNNHARPDSRLVKAGNETVLVDGLLIDRITITQRHKDSVVIELNDVAGQSVYAGLITSGGMPLLNKTNNAVKVIDLHGSFVPSLNGNMASSGDDTGTVTNGRKKIFGNYFLSSTGTINASRYASGNQYQVNRESSFYASISLLSGTDNGFEWQNPKYSLIAGAAATVQFLAKADHDITVTVLIKRKQASESVTLLAFATTIKGGDFQEFTFSFNSARSENDEAAVLSVEIRMDGVAANNVVYICAFRLNRGDTGLCRAANDYTTREIDSMLPMHTFY